MNKQINEKNRFISYKFIDSNGVLRDKVVKGLGWGLKPTWFDGSSFGFRPTHSSDLLLVPDEKTYHYDPIRKRPGVFCSLANPDGSHVMEDFRNVAYHTMNTNDETRGALFGVEPEFFVLDRINKNSLYSNTWVPLGLNSEEELKNVKQGEWYGSLPPTDKLQVVRDLIVENLVASEWVDVESLHHEVAPGQAEVSWSCDDLLRTSDKMMFVKYIVAATCDLLGYRACFDAKPFENLNGSGCHTHQSIPWMKDNQQILMAYAQGLVDHYDDLVKVCCVGPTSSKRLVPGFEAPTKENNGIGFCDRTKTIRIPAAGGRLEYRLPDPSMNPYVALSEMLKYGYDAALRSCGV